MRRFVAVDVETTGLNPIVHEMIEVGLVIEQEPAPAKHDGEWPLRAEVSFSLPFDIERADLGALQVNGWGRREFATQREPAWAAAFLNTVLDGVHLVGKNPAFDASFLAEFLRAYNFAPPWHHRLVDVGALAWGFFNGEVHECGTSVPEDYHPQPPNVEQAAKLLGCPLPEADAHTALGDARWAYQAFRHCVPTIVAVEA